MSSHNNQQLLSVATPSFLPPIDNASCFLLVERALTEAREKARELMAKNPPTLSGEMAAQKPGITLDLSHHRIATIPLEVVELIRDEIERLALAHNQISTFPDEFATLPRLRYLNLRSNSLKLFPVALTRLPSLEILDVSRNRIRTLPPDIGNLINLRVLSMSKNKINSLPTYIADMSDLKILKVDHNPIAFPPKDVWETNEDTDRDTWLEGVKHFLRLHAERASSTQESESGSSDDEIGGISPFSETRAPSMESDATLVNELDAPNLRTIRPFRPGPPEANKGVGTQGQKRAKHPSNSSITINSPFLTMNGSPQRSETPSSAVPSSPQTERIRSNSDSISNKERRRGMPPPPRAIAVPARPKTNFIPPQSIRPVDEKAFKHTRGYSHDSVIDGGQNNAHAPSRSPIDTERRPGQYFRRLSSLPEHKRSSLSSARVGEAARGILYSMSTLKHPIEQYIQSIGQPGGTESKVGRALYNSSTHVTTLVNALETYEAKDDEPAVQGVIDACQSCVAAFRQVLSMLQSSLKELGPGSSAPDARYARTLVLMIYGSYVEIQFSYDILRPLLVQHAVSDVSKARSASLTSRNQPPSMSFSQNRQLNGNSNVLIPDQSQMFIQAPLGTPRSFDSTFAMPQTPGAYTSQHSDSGFDQEDTLYQKFQAAASAAMLTLPQIDREIKSAVTQNLQPSVTLKLREISSLCASGCDASRRLSKIRWEAIQDGDQNERKKFWDDTNKFTQLVISIAELMKSVTSEYTFPKRTMAAMGTVLRPTKDLFILMNDSAFRHMAETQSAGGMHTHTFSLHSMNTPTMMPATPLSAALGPAAQATLPLMYQYGNSNGMMGMGGYSSSSSRTATLLSSHTPSMMSTSSEIGVNFPGNGGYASSPGPRMK